MRIVFLLFCLARNNLKSSITSHFVFGCRRCVREGGGQQMNGSLYRTCCCPLSSATGNHDTWGTLARISKCLCGMQNAHGPVVDCVRYQVWNWKVPLSSTSEIIFPLNLESGTFVMQALMSFYPLRLSPIIINIPHTASEKDSRKKNCPSPLNLCLGSDK